VKTNIGHLLSAAGIASFIKTVLSVKSGYLFPTLNCNQPNPKFNIEASPFFIVNEYQPWKTPSPRRAALSSFGFGGTNCHLIVEEFKPQYDNKELRKPLEKYIYNKTHYPLQEIKKDQIKEIEKLLKELVKGEIGIQEISHKLI
jgi:acyl transferase domain-containing protein